MSRTRHRRNRRDGGDKCICGRYHPCRILDFYVDIAEANLRRYRDRRRLFAAEEMSDDRD